MNIITELEALPRSSRITIAAALLKSTGATAEEISQSAIVSLDALRAWANRKQAEFPTFSIRPNNRKDQEHA